jgi:hypothetical protein
VLQRNVAVVAHTAEAACMLSIPAELDAHITVEFQHFYVSYQRI